MDKAVKRIMVFCLTSILLFAAVAAGADPEYVAIKTEGLDLLYGDGGLKGMTRTETDRARTALMAMVDLMQHDPNVSILDNYIFIGLDKDGPDKLMYVGFGGKKSSSMILYSPQNTRQHAVLVPIPMDATWVESFMSPFCGKTYWKVSPAVMKTLLKK